MGFYLVVVVVVVVLFVVLINDIPRRRRRARRRRTNTEREQLAQARGWAFALTDPSYVNRWRGDPFGRPGSRREVHGVVSGAAGGAAFAAFDYQRIHTVHRGAFASFETVTVWASQLPSPMPPVQVVRKRGALWLPTKDQRVPAGHPELDRRYVVTADSPELVGRVLTPEVVGLILQYDFESFIVEGQLAACCRAVKRGSGGPEQLEATLQQLVAVTSRLPIAS